MAVASLENGISYGEQFEGNNIQNVTAQMSLKIITCGDNCWSSFKKKKKKKTQLIYAQTYRREIKPYVSHTKHFVFKYHSFFYDF